MKQFLKNHRHLSRLGLAITAGILLAVAGLPSLGLFLVGMFQLLEFAMSKRCGVCYTTALTPEQVKEFGDIIRELGDFKTALPILRDLAPGLKDLAAVEGGFAALKNLPKLLKDQGEELTKFKGDLNEARRQLLARRNLGTIKPKGRLSDETAAFLGASFVRYLVKANKLDDVVPEESLRKALLTEARGYLGVAEGKDLSTSDIPLPVNYSGEIRDLIAEYGVLRNAMTMWPLSGGTDSPPRGKTRFGLTKTAMGAQLGTKSVQIEFASLEVHKVGGIIYTPRELREGSIVALGQYIARLGAVAAAQVEDEFGFLADGTATYDSISGVCKVANTNSNVVTLGAGKTKPSDVVVANLRGVFALVNSRVRGTGKWYLNNTWEAYLPEFNTQANQYTFRYTPGGEALLFGRPIVWTEVLQGYQETAAASTNIAVYGDLSYWWFGTRPGGLRIDESSDFKFDYDLIATRLIEEFDFDYMATDAAAAVVTAAV